MLSRTSRAVAAFAMAGLIVATPLTISVASAGDVPDQQACQDIEPIGLLDVLNVIDDVNRASQRYEYMQNHVSASDLVIGGEISKDDQEQIEQTLKSLIACVNARDAMRLLNLMTDHYQSLVIVDLLNGGYQLSAIAEQVPVILDAPDLAVALRTPDIQQAWYSTERSGMVMAIVSMQVPGYSEPVSFLISFEKSGEGWKIDAISKFDA